MSFLEDEDARLDRARLDQQLAKFAAKQSNAAFRAVMATQEGRQVVAEFLLDARVDYSPYRDDPAAMAHSVGWQDAGRWWLDRVRRLCHEKEGVMRSEARARARDVSKAALEGNDDD